MKTLFVTSFIVIAGCSTINGESQIDSMNMRNAIISNNLASEWEVDTCVIEATFNSESNLSGISINMSDIKIRDTSKYSNDKLTSSIAFFYYTNAHIDKYPNISSDVKLDIYLKRELNTVSNNYTLKQLSYASECYLIIDSLFRSLRSVSYDSLIVVQSNKVDSLLNKLKKTHGNPIKVNVSGFTNYDDFDHIYVDVLFEDNYYEQQFFIIKNRRVVNLTTYRFGSLYF